MRNIDEGSISSFIIENKYLILMKQVDWYKYLGNKEWMSEQDIRSRIHTVQETFNRKKVILCTTMNMNLRKRLVKSFIWSVLLYELETWTTRKRDEERIETLEMWNWR